MGERWYGNTTLNHHETGICRHPDLTARRRFRTGPRGRPGRVIERLYTGHECRYTFLGTLSSPLEPENKLFPEPLTVELLNTLRVPPECHPRLLGLKSENELLSCPGISDDILLRIDQYLFELPLVQVEQQPDLILKDPDDLLRYSAVSP